MNVTAYLERINYDGPLDPSAETLRRLHRAHMLSVPFENLDIHLHRPIVLEQERLLGKIVDLRRGGFCYELNGAFAALLGELGFVVEKLAAGVASGEGGFGPPFDHMALLVHMDERWLADVGFGDSFIEPLLLDEPGEQAQGDDSYLITQDDEVLTLQRRMRGEWEPQYRFTLQPYELSDYAEMCDFHQTSPDSPFTQRRTISRATADGRVTLTGTRLIITTGDERSEHLLAGPDEYAAALRENFGVELELLPEWFE